MDNVLDRIFIDSSSMCYGSSQEPNADQGYAESKLFIENGRVRYHAVPNTRQSSYQNSMVQTRVRLSRNRKKKSIKISQFIWLTSNQLQNK